MEKYTQFGNEYQALAKEIYEGIYKAYPEIEESLANEYARIAFYMINKNKTEMKIHAPKKSRITFANSMLELQKQKIKSSEGKTNIIEIENLRRTYKKNNH